MEYLLVALTGFRKRPRVKSVRFKAMAGLGAGASAVLAPQRDRGSKVSQDHQLETEVRSVDQDSR